MDYRDYNDYELVSYACDHNEEANDIIIKKYEPLIKSMASKYLSFVPNSGLELSDLVQEGLLGLTNAIDTFAEQKNVTFFTYAKTCIERKMIDAVNKATTLKHKILNESISFDDDDNTLDNRIGNTSSDPLNLIESLDNEKNLINNIEKKLTEREKSVFVLMLKHLTYQEIAKELNQDSKSVDNTIQRIRAKVREEIKNNI